MNQDEAFDALSALPPRHLSPQLAWEAAVDVGPREDLGESPLGHRFIVPILGGHFRGGPGLPEFHGTIEPGGADRQLLRRDGIRELDALYEMRIHDGTAITIRNRVLLDAEAPQGRYAVSRIEPVAPEGRWAWLNRRFFAGTVQATSPEPDFVIVRAFQIGLET
ncbi:MAG: DUF3237 domain-containing protein [Minwuia sp.]|uniref:DUF3237 domain-containing protein n=1 Tax=Minwuia sp. TaxID=2493630 RepID=UPI003A89B8C4